MDEITSYKIKYKQKWDALEIRPNVSKLSRAMSETHLRRRVQFIKDWKADKVLGGSRTQISTIVKAYLLNVCDNSCPACGYAGLNGNGLPNLDMVHINDNPYDHSYGNIMPYVEIVMERLRSMVRKIMVKVEQITKKQNVIPEVNL